MSKTTTIPFDPAEFLDDDETIAEYLNAALASGDAGHFQDALSTVARARGMSDIAKAAGLGRENLYNALRSGANPRFDTIHRVLTALGVELRVQAA